jgi:inner membrane transporter RhtA
MPLGGLLIFCPRYRAVSVSMSASSRFTLPPVPAVLLSIISVQAGAAIAKGLFPALGPALTASLRIGRAALLLLLVVRPHLSRLRAGWP